MDPEIYNRKSFPVEAIEVTVDNIEEVAEWCGGEIRSASVEKDLSNPRRYIKVRVIRPLNVRQTQAFIGDWVLHSDTGYKVYTDRGFKNSFEPAPVVVDV